MISAAAARRIVGIIGNVISFCLFLSPIPTFLRIFQKGAVEEFSPYPYIVTSLNCALWVFYGIITPNSLLVITINGGGLLIELIYVVIYFCYADNKQRKRPCVWCLAEIVFMVVVVLLCTLIPNPQSWRGVAIGILCVLVNIGMYAMPCEKIYQVYDKKSLEYMPFWLSLTTFLNGLCWLAYSLLGFDLYILISNGTGLVLGLIQISVIAYYFFKYPQPKDYILPEWLLKKFGKSQSNNIDDEKAGEDGKVELSNIA